MQLDFLDFTFTLNGPFRNIVPKFQRIAGFLIPRLVKCTYWNCRWWRM